MRIGIILRKWRLINEITTRTLALELGISASTLNRIENGMVIDGPTLMKIFNWLCVTVNTEGE